MTNYNDHGFGNLVEVKEVENFDKKSIIVSSNLDSNYEIVGECCNIFGLYFYRYDFDIIHRTYDLMSSLKGTTERMAPADALITYMFLLHRVNTWTDSKNWWSFVVEGNLKSWISAVCYSYRYEPSFRATQDLRELTADIKEAKKQIWMIYQNVVSRRSDEGDS